MGVYACGTTPLSNSDQVAEYIKKIFYADDGAAGGKLMHLLKWWMNLQLTGPPLGYFPDAGKTWLIVKPEYEQKAKELCPDINITTKGRKYLGSFIGCPEETLKFVEGKIDEWSKHISALADIAKTEPQLAYTAYVFGT